MQRQSLGDEFRSNVHRGGSPKKIKITKEAGQLALDASSALDLQFTGVDMIMSKRGPLVLEVNSSPGLEGIESVSNANIALECIDFLAYDNSKQSSF